MLKKFAFLCVLSYVVPLAAAQQTTVLAGGYGLTLGTLQARLGNAGQVVEIANGYYRIAPLNGFTPAGVAQKLQGTAEVLLPGTADKVNNNSLPSVTDHIRYINGAFQIRHGRKAKRGENTGAENFEAIQYFLSTRVDSGTGRLNYNAYRQAVQHRANMAPATQQILDPTTQIGAAAPAAWAYVGPRALGTPYQQFFGQGTLSGRKNSIAMASADGQTYYVGSANGGVWKTTNGGASFQPLSDTWPMMNVTGLAVDPNDANVVYAGTGDYYGSMMGGYGIMKSTDGGATWTNYGAAQFAGSAITRIAVVPSNPNIVLALVAGPAGDIWRSTDAGQTWTQTDAPDGDWQDIDVRLNGSYVAVSASQGIYRSTGNGANWVAVNAPASAGGSRWDIACSKSEVNRFYLVTSNLHVYRSVNAGSTWTDVTPFHDAAHDDPNLNWASAATNLFVEAVPGTGPEGFDVVYVGLRSLTVTDDNALNFADVTESLSPTAKVHAGMMCFTPDPSNPDRGLLGTEGGLSSITYFNPGNSATFASLNDTLFDVQFNTVAVHPTNTTQVMGGAIGNATPAARADLQNWKSLYDGDGGGVMFDLTTPGTHYTGSPFGGVYRYTFASDLIPDDISPGGGLFVAPLIASGAGGSVPTFGAANGDVRTYNGTSWDSHATGGGAIRSLTRSFFDTNRVYSGAENGDIYRTDSLGSGFTKIDSSLPNRAIGGMTESHTSQNTVIVGLQGLGFANMVYRCANTAAGTPAWTNVSGTGQYALPQVPVNDLEFDPYTNVYYAATDIGVFVSPDNGLRWFNLNAMGFPNVGVNDLWLYSNGASNFLYAATNGRGIWRCLLSQRFLTQILIAKPAIYGGQQNTVTLKMNGSAPAGSAVAVTDDSPNVSVTPLVTIPVGSTQATFTTFSTNPAADQTVTITGKVWGTTTTGSFTLHRIPAFTYTPGRIDIYGGDRISASIDLTMPAPITTVITFSDDATEVSSPIATSIAPGGQFANVSLYTLPVTTDVTANITARIANTTATSPVVLHPRPTLSSLMLSHTTIVGGNPVEGTLGLSFAGAGGDLEVSISDTSPAVGTPFSVTIPQGFVEQPFSITTNPVSVSITATIRARLNGVTRTTTLEITP